ncbi:hypothetical protein EDC22_104173 [Tepidamorphus gemmatus]|uniref:DUF192 domain-containing protein n=1 Tax=Tepidamorphus gemmatus TaxID=747076 RepID=A0A4R3MCI2_9HYPH|nr:DUF192 domain-containing protein [Tepidamorphus gemmatus]TCT11414.1 hypothetical protein EDC22_104173 [Tepidamorphus gemmatus]
MSPCAALRRRSPRRFGPLVLVLALALLAFQPASAQRADQAVDGGIAVVETASGAHSFTVELAETPAQRARGLMFRRQMAPDHGMLFDFGTDDEVRMWMQNTYISLDMVFITRDGVVHRIERNTTPLSTRTISSKGPVRSVLEVIAGTADRIGLKRGDVVRHPIFGNAE